MSFFNNSEKLVQIILEFSQQIVEGYALVLAKCRMIYKKRHFSDSLYLNWYRHNNKKFVTIAIFHDAAKSGSTLINKLCRYESWLSWILFLFCTRHQYSCPNIHMIMSVNIWNNSISVHVNENKILLNSEYKQLGTFFVNGKWACSPFLTKSGHADNPTTFVPCVKSMTADFKFTMFPTGGCPIISSDESLLLRKSFMTNTE